MPIFVLPGLDGTVDMLAKFRALAPETFDVRLLELPRDIDGYAKLVDHFGDAISGARDCVLIAESFSGPLAIMLAAEHPESVAALVLVASFVSSPVPVVARGIPWSLVFGLPLPSFVARRFMLGESCDPALVRELRSAVRSVSSRVLAGRLHQIMRVDVAKDLQEVACPIMYLRPTEDALVPRKCVETIRQLRPDAVIHMIAGPHLILQTEPAEAWKQIVPFTGALSPR